MADGYDVHIYTITRVKFEGIPESVGAPEAAVRYVEEHADLHSAVQRPGPVAAGEMEAADVEFAEEVMGYLVDQQNDPDFSRSQVFGANGNPEMVITVAEAERILVGLADLHGRAPRDGEVEDLIAAARAALGRE